MTDEEITQYLQQLKASEAAGVDEPCCICDRPAVRYYDDREDCPSCGRLSCEYQMQAAMDYHDDVGNR